jgi:hypothetical protein
MNIQELAVEARLKPALLLRHWGTASALTDTEQEELAQIEAFAKLVAAQEREACAKLCDEVGKESASQWPYRFANMIRARGEA